MRREARGSSIASACRRPSGQNGISSSSRSSGSAAGRLRGAAAGGCGPPGRTGAVARAARLAVAGAAATARGRVATGGGGPAASSSAAAPARRRHRRGASRGTARDRREPGSSTASRRSSCRPRCPSCSEPSTWIALPLRRYWQQFSAWRSQTVTSMNSVSSSRRSPSRPVQRPARGHAQLGHRRAAGRSPQLRVERQSTHQKDLVQVGHRLVPFTSTNSADRAASGLADSRPARTGHVTRMFPTHSTVTRLFPRLQVRCTESARGGRGVPDRSAQSSRRRRRGRSSSSSSRPAFLGVGVGRRGHGLVHQVLFQLGMHLEDQLAEDQVAEMAVGDDLLELRAVGLEVGQQVRPLLVAARSGRRAGARPTGGWRRSPSCAWSGCRGRA